MNWLVDAGIVMNGIDAGPQQDEVLASLDYAKPLQIDEELSRLIDVMRGIGAMSYLEVGARYGGSFEAILSSLPEGARGVALDFPGGHFGDAESPPILLAAINRLRAAGRYASTVFGPSGSEEVRRLAERRGPYDVVLIDADHAYEAVKRDFECYEAIAMKLVVLHDIVANESCTSHDGQPVEVPRFWNELKAEGRYRLTEIVTPGSNMGFGLVFTEETT